MRFSKASLFYRLPENTFVTEAVYCGKWKPCGPDPAESPTGRFLFCPAALKIFGAFFGWKVRLAEAVALGPN